MLTEPKIAVVGVGRAGGALALGLAGAGVDVQTLIVRERRTADEIIPLFATRPEILQRREVARLTADIVIVATRDGDIAATAEWLAGKSAGESRVFLHLSGALPSDVLAPLKAAGGDTGSLHPLVSLSSAESGAKALRGAYFGIEGDESAVEAANLLASKLGGFSLTLKPGSKAMYHAAAVTACGHFVALVDASLEMFGRCGIDGETAKRALLPLIESTAANLREKSPSEALTGPFARGDAGTIAGHLARLRADASDEILRIYCELGLRSLEIAARSGVPEDQRKAIRDEILLAKSKVR